MKARTTQVASFVTGVFLGALPSVQSAWATPPVKTGDSTVVRSVSQDVSLTSVMKEMVSVEQNKIAQSGTPFPCQTSTSVSLERGVTVSTVYGNAQMICPPNVVGGMELEMHKRSIGGDDSVSQKYAIDLSASGFDVSKRVAAECSAGFWVVNVKYFAMWITGGACYTAEKEESANKFVGLC